MIEIKLQGFQDVERKLRELGPKIAKNGLRASNYAGAAVLRDAVKDTAPVRTGQLKANIRIFKRQTPDTVVKHAIGVRGARVKYADTRENRRRHRVGKKYAAETRNTLVARLIEFGFHTRNGRFVPPNPFMRRALEANAQKAIDAVRARMGRYVVDAAKKS